MAGVRDTPLTRDEVAQCFLARRNLATLNDEMMTGEGTGELAEKFKLSAGRISQMRREFQAAWRSFCDE